MLYDPKTVMAAAKATQIESKVVTNETIQEIVRDMQSGAIVEEVEYDDIKTNVTEEGVEDVIYVGGKTRSIYTPKKNKDKVWRVFWDRIKSIKEEEEEGVDPTKGTLDQEDTMFGMEMEEDQESEALGGKDWEADQGIEEPEGNQQGWGGNTVGDLGWNEEEEQRGRGEERPRTPPRRVTSDGSPTPVRIKTESGAQKKERRTRSTTRRLGGEIVLGTTSNPIRVKADTKDSRDDDKPHPWELDTSDTGIHGPEGGSGTHGLEDNGDVECDIVEALLANAPETRPAPAATLNVSKHAPAEHSKAQIDLSKRLTLEISEEQDKAREARKEDHEMTESQPSTHHGTGSEGKEEKKEPSIWDRILGKGWEEQEGEIEIGQYFVFLNRVLGDTKKMSKENMGDIKLGTRQKKKLGKLERGVALGIGKIIDKLGKWDEAKKALMVPDAEAIKEWCNKEDEERKNEKEGQIKQMADSISIMVAKAGYASNQERVRAKKKEKEREEEKKKEEKNKEKSRGLTRLANDQKKEDEERKKQKDKLRQAEMAVEVQKAELQNLKEQERVLCREQGEAKEEKEQDELREKLREIGEKIAAVKKRNVVFEENDFRASTGTSSERWRKVGVVSTHTGFKEGKEGEKQMEEAKEKVNGLLREVERADGQVPFGMVEEVRHEGVWGDKNERRWKLIGVHRDEGLKRVGEVMRAQVEAVLPMLGVETVQLFINETQPPPTSVVVGPIPDEVGEGASLVAKFKEVGMEVTPRWPWRLGTDPTGARRMWKLRVEVKSTAEAS